MDAPPIRYARTRDGVNVGYWTMGGGTPLIILPLYPFMNCELSWESDGFRRWIGRLSAKHAVTCFDFRGVGASEAKADFSDDAMRSDLEAIVAAVAPDGCTLLGMFAGAVVAVKFAVGHPELVTKLVTFNGVISQREYVASTAIAETRQLLKGVEDDPSRIETYAVVASGPTLGASPPPGETEALRAVVTANVARIIEAGAYMSLFVEAAERMEALDLLPEVRAPTLVMQRNIPWFNPSFGRTIAAGIPNATLHTVVGDASLPYIGDADDVVALIEELTLDYADPEGLSAGFQTIVFTDLEASTPLTQRLGDEGAQELLRGHNKVVREALDEHGGREVKHTGDGIMASFPSAVSAVTAALQIQRGLSGGEVRVRVGLNAGEPIAEDDDLFGLSVIKAARIADRAEPGQILVSNVVMELCEGKTFEFASLGAVSLKGFDEAVNLYEVTT